MKRLLLLLASSMLAVTIAGTAALAESKLDERAEPDDGAKLDDKNMPDSVENAPASAPLSGEVQGKQGLGRSDCQGRSDNPHLSRHASDAGEKKVYAHTRSWCQSTKRSVKVSSTLRRWRYYGWSVALNRDSTSKQWSKRAYNGVGRNCDTLPTINTWYKVWSYHQAINRAGQVSSARTSNQSNEKLSC